MHLDIAANRLGDESVAELADTLRFNSSLQKLNISCNQLGPAGKEVLLNAWGSREGLLLNP